MFKYTALPEIIKEHASLGKRAKGYDDQMGEGRISPPLVTYLVIRTVSPQGDQAARRVSPKVASFAFTCLCRLRRSSLESPSVPTPPLSKP